MTPTPKIQFNANGFRFERLELEQENLSQKESGLLQFFDNEMSFSNWAISYSDVINANLHVLRKPFSRLQTLTINTDEYEYLFVLKDRVDENPVFPFHIEMTEEKRYLDTPLILALVCLALVVVVKFLSRSISSLTSACSRTVPLAMHHS